MKTGSKFVAGLLGNVVTARIHRAYQRAYQSKQDFTQIWGLFFIPKRTLPYNRKNKMFIEIVTNLYS